MTDKEKDAADLQVRLRDGPKLPVGIFRHYKNGNDYQLIDRALHTETKEIVAVYKALYEPFEMFVRPWSMFFEMVDHNGEKVPRFKKVL